MNEALLQYLWNYKKLTSFDFKTTKGVPLEILDFGRWNHDSGPDFLMAKIKIDGVTLVGNLEMHVRSSDWILHRHSGNPEFDNLILHVVYQDDVDIPKLQEKGIPTLELRGYINESLLWKYAKMQEETTFIPCEKFFTPTAVPFGFAEETLLRKLDAKSEEYGKRLLQNKNDFETLLFQELAYAFGLKINSEIFRQMAHALDFKTVRKVAQEHSRLEALFFGIFGWLQKAEDPQTKAWKKEFEFLKSKYPLPTLHFTPKFSKLHPPNFPTIRLSQLAHLYSSHENLYSFLIRNDSMNQITNSLLTTRASDYWDNHFVFGKLSKRHFTKTLSKTYANLILFNTILPFQYFYLKYEREEAADMILERYRSMAPENNWIIDQWDQLGVKFENGLETQAFLYHYKTFCKPKKCLDCSICYNLLKNVQQS